MPTIETDAMKIRRDMLAEFKKLKKYWLSEKWRMLWDIHENSSWVSYGDGLINGKYFETSFELQQKEAKNWV